MLQIIEKLAPLGKARSGRQRTGFAGVTIHNTGNTSRGANAKAHANYLMQNASQMSWHYAVDENGAYRSIPENEVAWHAGDGRGDGNYKTIAIEICMNSDGSLLKATDNAVELTADILKRNGIKDVGAFVHQHNRWSGKNCPQMIRQGNPYNWETFLTKVDAIVNPKPQRTYAYKVGDRVLYSSYYKDGNSTAPVLPSSILIGTITAIADTRNCYTIDNSIYCNEGDIRGLAPQKTYLTVNTRLLPLRLNRSFNGKTATGGKLLSMPKGSKVELLQKMNNQWYKVKYNGVVGYASSEYLK